MIKELIRWPCKSCEPCPFETKVIEIVEKEFQSFIGDYTNVKIKIECEPNVKGEARMYYSVQEKKNKLTIPVHAWGIGAIICPSPP